MTLTHLWVFCFVSLGLGLSSVHIVLLQESYSPQPGMVLYNCNLSVWEAEVGSVRVCGGEGGYEFKVNLGDRARPCLATKQTKPKKTPQAKQLFFQCLRIY